MTGKTGDTPTDVETVSTEVLSDGFRRMVRHRVRNRRNDGTWSGAFNRDLHEGNRVAAVIAYDPARDSIVLLRQFRLAAHLSTGRGMMVEIPAGGVEPGEEPAEAARREMHEETKLEVRSLHRVYEFMPSPGITTESATIFLAEVDASALPDFAGEDEDEDIAPMLVALDDALAMARSGTTANGFLLMALFWLAMTGRDGVRRILGLE